jgi:hypothetical protein
MTKTSANLYALTYLMPSGKILVQDNFSTSYVNPVRLTVKDPRDYDTNTEYALLVMPGQVIRVYLASGANAMLPLTPFGYIQHSFSVVTRSWMMLPGAIPPSSDHCPTTSKMTTS